MKIRTLLTAASTLVALGGIKAMAPNGDVSRKTRLRAFETKRIAHRGFFDNAMGVPENSLPAFGRAVEKGYGIELDVRLTKDKEPVVIHDKTLLRTAGANIAIEDITLGELQKYRLFGTEERIPCLGEALKLIDGKVPLIIEIKAKVDVNDICRETMKELYCYPGDYCIESFSPLVLKWLKEHEPNVLRGQLSLDFFDPQWESEESWPVKFAATNLLTNVISKPDFIAYDFHCAGHLPLLITRKIHEAKIAAWNVKSDEDMALADRNFDIVIFDGFTPEA